MGLAWGALVFGEFAAQGAAAQVLIAVAGGDPLAAERTGRRWWELLVVAGALAVFVWLALSAERQPIEIDVGWMAVLVVASVGLLIACGLLLWKRTRFS